jgi:hypothetical protein
MRVKILRIEDNEFVEAIVEEGKKVKLPSLQEGWRFNFTKYCKMKGASTFALITEETPSIIEGCLIYKMKNEHEPYMAFIEIAYHNQGKQKKYALVAGCLIAFACMLSYQFGEGPFKGWLAFDVLEETSVKQNKLMSHYSTHYKAQRIANSTTMIIAPKDGELLIQEFLAF